MRRKRISALALLVAALPFAGSAAEMAGVECAKSRDDKERLACYDRLLPPPAAQPQPASTPRSYLTLAWNLDNQTNDDKNFNMGRLRTYRQNYFIFTSTNDPNLLPSSPAPAHQTLIPYDYTHSEAKFQLSFKADMWDRTFARPLLGVENIRLWMGYTQQSHWQIFNTQNSSPFRETNYEPEFIATLGTGHDDGLKLINVGLVHQSNGQSGALSRSWHRAYAQGGWEWNRWQNSLSAMVRIWYRLPENAAFDDNPDLVSYLGRGDVVLRWEPEDKSQAIAILMRNNFQKVENRGFFQLDWSLPRPMGNSARLHLQLSSGYGENLLDYNHRQIMAGLGLSFREW